MTLIQRYFVPIKMEQPFRNSGTGVPIKRNLQIAEILKWVLEGFNKAFLKKADINKESFEQLKEEYIQELSVYIEILKAGFVERKE